MKSVALLYNSPVLGGAERSITSQILNLNECKITYVIPIVDGVDQAQDLKDHILESSPNAKITYLQYPRGLYSASRSGGVGVISLFKMLIGMIQILMNLKRLDLGAMDVLWTNGNKIGLPVLLFSKIISYEGIFIWHFRDYPFNGGIYRHIWKQLKKSSSLKKILLANSFSVEKSIKELMASDCNNSEIMTIYNPVGNIQRRDLGQDHDRSMVIGVASMLAPWKGIHTVLEFERMYRNELKELGIREIAIYGGDTYSTKGEHQNYLNQLLELSSQDSLISFKGKQQPKDIFANIDILLHTSLRPEPFGRVIIEAFAAGIPVVSTCLGGSGELVVNSKSGLRIHPYDHAGLYSALSDLSEKSEYMNIAKGAQERLVEVESQQTQFWKELNMKI